MTFKDRSEAGKLLALRLQEYKNKKVIVYALPRGGVVVALEVADYLNAPLDVVIARKITHPNNSEYAIAAVAEDGHLIGNKTEIASVNENWFEEEVDKQREEAKRRRELFVGNNKLISPKNMTAILIDDGVATGLTLKVGIKELQHRHPKKLIVAVPVITIGRADEIKKEVDLLLALTIPSEDLFRGSTASYYETFGQVDDETVVNILNSYKNKRTADSQKIGVI